MLVQDRNGWFRRICTSSSPFCSSPQWPTYSISATPPRAPRPCCALSPQRHTSVKPQMPKINWNDIPAILDKSSPYANFRSKKRIIVSVSNYPSDSLRKLTKLKGWQVFAVGNSKTPKDWSLKAAIYLAGKRSDPAAKPLLTLLGMCASPCRDNTVATSFSFPAAINLFRCF
nr:probable glycosyltransferase STELLO2 [Ipomoea batatas]